MRVNAFEDAKARKHCACVLQNCKKPARTQACPASVGNSCPKHQQEAAGAARAPEGRKMTREPSRNGKRTPWCSFTLLLGSRV